MLDLSVIILTYNEEIHIQRCIENANEISNHIFVVDSFSTDKTVKIAEQLGAKVYQNPFVNQAVQFNWALDNLPVQTKWVFRLDSDEYLSKELINEIYEKLDLLSENISGVIMPLRRVFMGKVIKRGTGTIKLLRLFKYKKGRSEVRNMDEHIQLLEGKTVEFEHDFADHNLNNLTWWTAKHNGYAIREAIDLLDVELGLLEKDEEQKTEVRRRKSEDGSQKSEEGNPASDLRPPTSDNPTFALSPHAAAKRRKKLRYAKQPLFWRSFAYFVYRYFFKLGFVEGKEGFMWHFLQGWWYRTLVDVKIWEIKKACGTDKSKIKEYIRKEYGMKI